MKKLLLIIAVIATAITASARGADKQKIRFAELPAVAQEYVKTQFGGATVVSVVKEIDDNEYELRLKDGTEMEFDAAGNLIEITNERAGIRESVLPTPVRNYVKANYPGRKVKHVENDARGYEVEIINGPEFIVYK